VLRTLRERGDVPNYNKKSAVHGGRQNRKSGPLAPRTVTVLKAKRA